MVGTRPQGMDVLALLFTPHINTSMQTVIEPEPATNESLTKRWRGALLELTAVLVDAAKRRKDLAEVLMSGLNDAISHLLLNGSEKDLTAIEEWLEVESSIREKRRAGLSGSF